MSEHLSPLDIERLGDGELDFQSHVSECLRCSNEVLAIVQMKRAIAALPRRVGAGSQPALRFGPAKSRPLHMLAVAAAIAVVAVLSTVYVRSRDGARELIDMHSTIVASAQPVDVLSTDRHTVKPWFEGRVPFAVEVPDLSKTAFRVAGGRVVFWHGQPGAYLLVTKGAHRISVLAFTADEVPRIAPMPQMTIVTWRRNGIAYFAIGDIPRIELEALRETFS
jgi:anti-sigma factor RsiW